MNTAVVNEVYNVLCEISNIDNIRFGSDSRRSLATSLAMDVAMDVVMNNLGINNEIYSNGDQTVKSRIHTEMIDSMIKARLIRCHGVGEAHKTDYDKLNRYLTILSEQRANAS